MGMTKKEFDKMRDTARDAAKDSYEKARDAKFANNEPFSGDVKKEAASTAIEAAGKVMIDMVATPEMVDTMKDIANKEFIDGYNYDGGITTPAQCVFMTLIEMAPK